MSWLHDALADYLHVRRRLGYEMPQDGRLLEGFVAFLEQTGAERITTELALTWARFAGGGWFVRQHETPLMKAQFYDPYGVYPLNLAAHGLRLGDDNFWPSSGPLRTAVNQGQVSVIPAAEFAIISGD